MTSLAGRFQFSVEKANSVRWLIPRSGQLSTISRTRSAPRRCPAMRGSPRLVAQRPLPSMMIATWLGPGAGLGRSSMYIAQSTSYSTRPARSLKSA